MPKEDRSNAGGWDEEPLTWRNAAQPHADWANTTARTLGAAKTGCKQAWNQVCATAPAKNTANVFPRVRVDFSCTLTERDGGDLGNVAPQVATTLDARRVLVRLRPARDSAVVAGEDRMEDGVGAIRIQRLAAHVDGRWVDFVDAVEGDWRSEKAATVDQNTRAQKGVPEEEAAGAMRNTC